MARNTQTAQTAAQAAAQTDISDTRKFTRMSYRDSEEEFVAWLKAQGSRSASLRMLVSLFITEYGAIDVASVLPQMIHRLQHGAGVDNNKTSATELDVYNENGVLAVDTPKDTAAAKDTDMTETEVTTEDAVDAVDVDATSPASSTNTTSPASSTNTALNLAQDMFD